MGRRSLYEERKEPILKVIRALDKHGSRRAPSVREISEATGVSVATLHSYLQKMHEEGLISWQPRSHRTIRPKR